MRVQVPDGRNESLLDGRRLVQRWTLSTEPALSLVPTPGSRRRAAPRLHPCAARQLGLGRVACAWARVRDRRSSPVQDFQEPVEQRIGAAAVGDEHRAVGAALR
jgi:hypothetical protein